jgi:diguanylate cyclase (GGDEF)-like protein
MSEPGPPRPTFRISLKAKILVFVILCVGIPLFVTGLYLLQRTEEILGDKVRETLSNQLFRRTSQIDEWMSQRQREAARWSASFVVYEGVETLSHRGADPVRIRRDLKDYLESVLGHYRVYESLFIVDLSGQVLAATREEQLEDWGQQLLAKGGPGSGGAVSPLHRSEYLARPTLLIVQPIQDRLNRTVGYFVERLDLRELEALLAPPETGPALNFWLLDETGHVLARAGKVENAPGRDSFPVLPPSASSADPWNRPVSEAELPGLGRTVYGLTPLVGPIHGALAATIPAAAAYRSLEESTNRLLKFGIPVIVAIFALNFLAAGRMLRPILRLSEGANRVSAGDLDVYLPVAGNDEIADLTQAFNEMAAKIREGRQSLEQAHDELARTNEGLKAANRTLEALAITDGLTGLYNHRHFQETLDKEIRRCEREGRMLSLLLCDLDHFKQYNDRFGHTEGDAALRRVAGQIMKSIRSTDMAFRYGGEEMVVLLPSCTKEQAAEVGEKIRSAVSNISQRPGRFGGKTTVSIGVATFPEDGRVARGLVDTADAALYAAKAQGRDRVVLAGAHIPPKSETAG